MSVSSLSIPPVAIAIVGIVGFGAVLLYDLLQLGTPSRWRSIVSLIGASGVMLATAGLLFLRPLTSDQPIYTLSPVLAIPALCLAILSLTLLFRSVYIEIPHSAIRSGESRRVIRSGSYSWSRHPGFLWYLLLVISIATLANDLSAWLTGMVLVAMDLIVVIVEDRFVFPRLFSDYTTYRKEVPMLIPRLIDNGTKLQ